MNKLCYRILLLSLGMFLAMQLLEARPRKTKTDEPESFASLLASLTQDSPAAWPKGMPFVFLSDRIGLSLTPEEPLVAADTLPMFGTRWLYDSMVSEEDWMGRELLQLRFLSPQGRAYRYSTGRPMESFADSSYHPALVVLYPEQLVRETDSLLRARTLYILYNDDRVFYDSDTLVGNASVHPKFVPVVIDSVGIGNELAPLCVHFTADGQHGHLFTSLPSSRQEATSTSLTRFFSIQDPYLSHPDITTDVWQKIQISQVQPDMTAEEVRLSWGRPTRVERAPTRNGMIEFWYYSNNRILQFSDGRLNKIGIL